MRSNEWTSLPSRVFASARERPDAVAVRHDGATLTYAEAAARIRTYATGLSQHFDTPQPLVAVCLERTLDLPIWLLAILQARAAYLPLDPTLPEARFDRIVRNAHPALILASERFAQQLPATELPLLIAEKMAESIQHDAPLPDPAASDLAYVLYTSGSTGEPKGVEIEHGAVTALFDAISPTLGPAPGDRLLAMARTGFDMSVLELLLPLTCGGEIVVAPERASADPLRLLGIMADAPPDIMQATPATFRALLEAGWTHPTPRRLLCGGEVTPPDLARRLQSVCGELWNMYGPTETTVWSTAYRVGDISGEVPIGRAIAGTDVTIVDATLAQVADGERGEIVITGPSLARGYRNDAALTTAKFVTLPDGRRGYRTGDVGSVDRDGLLRYHGRSDDQVKIRGFRIELGDVENALAQHPDIAWSAARAWTDQTGVASLVGYVVWRAATPPPWSDVTDFLRAILPDYMLPDRFVAVVAMPLSQNGKVDRRALPDPASVLAPRADSDSVPMSDTERQLAALWCEILSLAAVGPNDDFFDLGGYSLLTVRLQRRIEERFGRVIDLPQLLGASSLRTMAQVIDGGDADAGSGIVLLDRCATGRPLYWLDCGPLLRDLSRAMPADVPIATLNVLRADEEGFGANGLDLSAVAALLRDRLLETGDRGPFRIGGWCRWGVVAHELACQLRDLGHEVEMLVLLDADAPRRETISPLARLRRRFRRAAPPLDAAPLSFSQRVELAARSHPSRPFDGDTLLLRPAAHLAQGDRWRSFVRGELAIEGVPGTHLTMLQGDNVRRLAAIVSGHILARGRAGAPEAPQAPVMPIYRAPASLPLLLTTSEPIRAPLAERTTRLME